MSSAPTGMAGIQINITVNAPAASLIPAILILLSIILFKPYRSSSQANGAHGVYQQRTTHEDKLPWKQVKWAVKEISCKNA
jgi:hypothetical protein